MHLRVKQWKCANCCGFKRMVAADVAKRGSAAGASVPLQKLLTTSEQIVAPLALQTANQNNRQKHFWKMRSEKRARDCSESWIARKKIEKLTDANKQTISGPK